MALTIISQPGDFVAARNPIAWLVGIDTNWKTYTDYYVELRIEVERDYGTSVFFPLTTFREYGNDRNQVEFDIRRRLESQVGYDMPVMDQIGVLMLANTARKFKVTFKEIKEGVETDSISQDTRFAYNAGFSAYAGQKMTSWVTDGLFLTNAPRNLAITDVQPFFLDWVAQDFETYTCKAQIFFDNGTDITIDIDDYDADKGDILRWAVGWKQAGMHIQTNEVSYYEIYIHDGTSIVSERFRFSCSCEPAALQRYYLFLNSLGGYDCLCARGKLSSAEVSSSVTVRRLKGPFEAATVPEVTQVNTEMNESCEQYAGFFNREQAMWLREIRRTEDAYRIGGRFPNYTGGGQLVPITIARKGGTTWEDEELPEVKFSYEEAITHYGI